MDEDQRQRAGRGGAGFEDRDAPCRPPTRSSGPGLLPPSPVGHWSGVLAPGSRPAGRPRRRRRGSTGLPARRTSWPGSCRSSSPAPKMRPRISALPAPNVTAIGHPGRGHESRMERDPGHAGRDMGRRGHRLDPVRVVPGGRAREDREQVAVRADPDEDDVEARKALGVESRSPRPGARLHIGPPRPPAARRRPARRRPASRGPGRSAPGRRRRGGSSKRARSRGCPPVAPSAHRPTRGGRWSQGTVSRYGTSARCR